MSKKQMGFTLIEIVMVLVLLGILSAIAVPKYFDLRDQAEQKAMAATAAEYQARLNAGFAQALLDNKTCDAAVGLGLDAANANADKYGSYSIGDGISNDTRDATATLTITRAADFATGGMAANSKTFDIAIPQCKLPTSGS